MLDASVLEQYRPKTRHQESKYGLEDHPQLAPDRPMRALFDKLRIELLALDPNITEEVLKLYIAYKAETNVVDVVPPDAELPHLPVARAVWKPQPDFATSAEAWLMAGAAHHTVLTTQVGLDAFVDLADIARTELLTIDGSTTSRGFAQEIRWNHAYYRLAQGF